MKAWMLFATRGVRAAHGMHIGCQAGGGARRGRPSVAALTIAPCSRGAQSLWHPDPEPLDLVHERRVDHVRFGPRRGGDLLMINDVAAWLCRLPHLPHRLSGQVLR